MGIRAFAAAFSIFTALVVSVAPVAAQAQTSGEDRVNAVIAAISAGDTAAYEQTAQTNFAPAALARRQPADRAQLVQRLSGDFGVMEVVDVSIEGSTITAGVRGATGLQGSFVFTIGAPPENLIEGLRIEVGGEAGGGHGGGGPQIPAPPVNSQMSGAEMGAAIDQWLAPFLSADDFTGVVLVARDGTPVVTRAYGLADREANRAANADTLYNVASIGKKFTHVAIARLIQDGRLRETQTIGELLPDYPNAEAHTATISQLINMRGGISDFFGPAFEQEAKSRFTSNHAYYEFVSQLPQRFAPGSRSEYCNGCYIVLGEIIERVSGMPFEQYIQRTVFEPAGMQRSGYHRRDRQPANFSNTYVRSAGPGSPYRNSMDHHGVTGSGAGGVYSTAGDLLAFDNALRDGRLLNRQMTAWVLGGGESDGRNTQALGIAGGGAGASNVLESDGRWTVIVTANVQEPLPERLGSALARQLSR